MKKLYVVLIIFIIIIGSLCTSFFEHKANIQRKEKQINIENQQEKESNKLVIDKIPPVLKLTSDKITISKGGRINYDAFIKEASDNMEGEISKNVTHNEIDTSISGYYEIIYTLEDKAGNRVSAKLIVKVSSLN